MPRGVRTPRRSTEFVQTTLQRIATGELEPGARLPTEAELSELYSMSRSAVRDGVQTLVGKGMIVTQQGRGTSVAPRDNWQKLDPEFLAYRLGDQRFAYLFELREMLEPLIARLAAERGTPDHQRSLRRTLRRQQDAIDDNDVTAFAEHDLLFHQQLAAASGNPLLDAMYETVTLLGRELREQSVGVPGAMDRAVEFHTEILHEIEAGNAEAAEGKMVAYMRQARGELEKARSRSSRR